MAWPVLPHGFLGTQGVLTDEDTYQIERSLRFNSADSANLTRTPSSAGNRKTFTISFWAKRSSLSSNFHFIQAGPDGNTTTIFSIGENGGSPDNINLTFFDYQSGSYTTRLISTQVFRDPSAWIHFVASIDTTQLTASSRVRLYANGSQITSFSTSTYPSQNQDLVCNNNVAHRIGSYVTARYSDGYITEYNFIDGQALTPSSFGETDAITGRWKAKAYSGTYGTNGFYLNFSDNSALTTASNVGIGKDFSGNSNYFATTNLSITAGVGNDSLIDTPTNYGNLTHTFSDDTYQIERSLRFNSADSAFLNRTPSSATSRTVWTFSCWVKRSALNSNYTIFSAGTSASTKIAFEANDVGNGDSIRVFDYDGASFNGHKITTALYRDTSSWYHIVVAWNTAEAAADRIKIYVNGNQVTSFSTNTNAGTGNTSVNNNVLHRVGQRSDAASGYFNGYLTEVYLIDGQALTPDSFGVRDANTYVWKPKAYSGTYGTNGFYLKFADNSGTTATTLGKDSSPNGNNWTPNNFAVGGAQPALYSSPNLYTNASDVITNGTPLSSGSTFSSVYVYLVTNGGGDVGSTVFTADGSGNIGTAWTWLHRIGEAWTSAGGYNNSEWDSFTWGSQAVATNYIMNNSAPLHMLVPSAGSPQQVSGTIATFNIRPRSGINDDSLVDSPAYYGTDTGLGGEVRGDYCTLSQNAKATSITITNGNLDYSQTASAGIVLGEFNINSGKWYWEMHSGGTRNLVGIAEVTTPVSSTYVGSTARAYGYYGFNGNKYNNGTNSVYGATFTTGDIIGVALNLDAGTLEFFKNNVSQGVAFTGLSGTFSPAIGDGTASSASFNFGQRPFVYAAPSGFKTLRDYNRQLVPTGGIIRGNYATMNDINPVKPTGYLNGALQISGGGNLGGVNTFGMTSGKWFCEMDIVAIGAESSIGISRGNLAMSTYVGASTDSWGYYLTGNKYNGGSAIAYGTSFTTGDTIGCAFDADLGLLSFYKNGIPYGVAYSGLTSGPYFFASSGRSATSANNVYMNFGQRPWSFGPPAEFKPVCVTSIPQPTIQKPSSAMDVVTYTGTGASRSISSLGFSPDLVWVKGRSGATDHALYDTTRGVQKDLGSNLTTDETTQTQGLTSFDSTGFTIGTLAKLNTNTSTYVAWCWDESVQAGMDIVSYTGNGANRTIDHNLGVAPKMIIVKARTTAGADQGWPVWHTSIANTTYLGLNSTSATATGADYWNSTSPTSSVFSLGANAAVNANNDTYISYLFSEIDGYSKFGSYTGNNSADGPFIWCGFRPRWVIIKRIDANAKPWCIHDTGRDISNVSNSELEANSSTAENGGTYPGDLDILSNGFKLREAGSAWINEPGNFIFAAFAESPFKYARAR